LNLYHVQFSDCEGLPIFAESSELAEHLVGILLASNFAEDTCFSLSEPVGLLHLSQLEICQLQAALALNVQGCGVYNRHSGWQIVRAWQYPLTLNQTYKHDEAVPSKKIGSPRI
jgi:hypothetical protein